MMPGTIWQFDVTGADSDTVELGRDVARSRATEARAGKQWFLTTFLVTGRGTYRCVRTPRRETCAEDTKKARMQIMN